MVSTAPSSSAATDANSNSADLLRINLGVVNHQDDSSSSGTASWEQKQQQNKSTTDSQQSTTPSQLPQLSNPPSSSFTQWKLTNYSSSMYSEKDGSSSTRSSSYQNNPNSDSHRYYEGENNNPSSAYSARTDHFFPSPFATQETHDFNDFTFPNEEASPLTARTPVSAGGGWKLDFKKESAADTSANNGPQVDASTSEAEEESDSESTNRQSQQGTPIVKRKHLKKQSSKRKTMRDALHVSSSENITNQTLATKKGRRSMHRKNSSRSITSTHSGNNSPTQRTHHLKRKSSKRKMTSRSHRKHSSPIHVETTQNQVNTTLSPINQQTSSRDHSSLNVRRPKLQHSKSSSFLLGRQARITAESVDSTASQYRKKKSKNQKQSLQAKAIRQAATRIVVSGESAETSRTRDYFSSNSENYTNSRSNSFSLEKQKIWKNQLQERDKQLIYLLKREEARISRLRASLASWKLLDQRRRETIHILLSLCTEKQLPAKNIEEMILHVDECYQAIPRNLIHSSIFQTKSEHESFLETHGILHKVLFDINHVKDETKLIRKDRKFILHDVIQTMETQNRQIVTALKTTGKTDTSTQTDEDLLFQLMPNQPKAIFLRQNQAGVPVPNMTPGFLDNLDLYHLLDDAQVLEFLQDLPPRSAMLSKFDEIHQDLEERFQKSQELLNSYEDEYLQERNNFKKEKEANLALLEKLQQELAATTNPRKRKLATVQVKKMESTLKDIEVQHQHSINLLVHKIKEAKQESEKLHREKVIAQDRAQFYHQSNPSSEVLQNRLLGPQGHIALMFTDVQHSSKLWSALGHTMAHALEIHNNLISLIIHETGGYYVKSEGDAVMCAFQNVEKAVECAMRIQLELLHAEWPEELLSHPSASVVKDENGVILFRGLRVRIGIHAGEPIHGVDPYTGRSDYFGPVCNVSASVEGTAHFGGQVAVSDPVWKRIEDNLYFDSVGPIHVQECRSHVELKGATEPMAIRLIVPKKIARREYPKLDMKLEDRYEVLKEKMQRMRLQMDLLKTVLNKKEQENYMGQEDYKRRIETAAQEKVKKDEEREKLLREVASMRVIKQEEYETMQAILAKQKEVSKLEKSILHKEKDKTAKQLQKTEKALEETRLENMQLLKAKALLEVQNLNNIATIHQLNHQLDQAKDDKNALMNQNLMHKELAEIHESNKLKLLRQVSDLSDQLERIRQDRENSRLQLDHAQMRVEQMKEQMKETDTAHKTLIKSAKYFRQVAHERVAEARRRYFRERAEISSLREQVKALCVRREKTQVDLNDSNKSLLVDIASIMQKYNQDDPHLKRYLEAHWNSLSTNGDDQLAEEHLTPEEEQRRVVEVLHRSHAQLRSLLHELRSNSVKTEQAEGKIKIVTEENIRLKRQLLRERRLQTPEAAQEDTPLGELYSLPAFYIDGEDPNHTLTNFHFPNSDGRKSGRSNSNSSAVSKQSLVLDLPDGAKSSVENPQKKRFSSIPFRHLKSAQLSRRVVKNPPGLTVSTPISESSRHTDDSEEEESNEMNPPAEKEDPSQKRVSDSVKDIQTSTSRNRSQTVLGVRGTGKMASVRRRQLGQGVGKHSSRRSPRRRTRRSDKVSQEKESFMQFLKEFGEG